jgi:GH15 family glucan-1,4-alpha-glucosidase
VNWLQNYVGKRPHTGEQLPTMFTIFGEEVPDEIVLDHWEGYMGSGPVRIGNGANKQYQADIYGELMDSLYLYNKHVGPINYDFWVRIRHRLDWICDNWQLPDEGIWEMRSGKQNFVYSKLMNWVALDRGVRLADKRSFPGNRERWLTERDAIYEAVMTNGWNENRKAFTQYYGSDDLDASALIMPLVFFMAPSDPRMISTIKGILQEPRDGGLVSDGLVYRYPPQPRVDGLPGEEGTFNMCSFWLVEALTRAGQQNLGWLDEARLLFERMLNYANHLGLYAEQTSAQGQALGNYPQAFTHLALISAAFNLDRTLGKN